ncbi:MAG: phage terminase large subunit [Rhodospirillales bacterium]|nr:phage terminase large subunit [Rhodospirillales bacterium]
MVLMPPGSAKSTYASVVFPTWWLHRHPRSSVIAASHTAALATHFGRQVRNLIGENGAALGYRLAGDNRAAARFRTSLDGEYFATGLDGPITGRRADLVLIDDPIKSHAEAESAGHRDLVWNWYRSELVSRLKPGGRIALIMTRWHEDDLSGRLLEQGDGWHVLRFPALAEAGDPLGRAEGEALWPDWENEAALARKREIVGTRVWEALYQQRPRTGDGAFFYVARVEIIDSLPEGLPMVRAWDLAATAADAGRDPDWTVGVKLARHETGRFIVVDVARMRGGPHEVQQLIQRTAERDGPGVPIGLPQDPGQAGKTQVAWLTGMLDGYAVQASPESGAKLVRAMPVAALVEGGNLALLRGGWNRALLDEMAAFPAGRKDDQVDALARGFSMLHAVRPGGRRLHVPLIGR